MIYLLDTNVLSETMRPAPSPAVASWLRKLPLRSLFTAAICQAEILAGVAVLAEGRRRSELEAMAAGMFSQDFDGRILPFDSSAAAAYAQLFAIRRQKGTELQRRALLLPVAIRPDADIMCGQQ